MKKIKLFFSIFIGIFLILFLIFNGVAFFSIIRYKTKSLISEIKYEITRPPLFLVKTQTTIIKGNLISFLKNLKEKLTTSTNLNFIPSSRPSLMNYYLSFLKKPLISYSVNTLILPKFEIEAPIISVQKLDSKIIYQKLKRGVVLYPGSNEPGQGYSIIIGHSSQYPWETGRYKSVFSLLNQFSEGDLVYVVWNQKLLVFKVIAKKIFVPWPKGEESTETVFPPSNEKVLVLQSCWPVGVAAKRVAVKTVLIDSF
ncbi:MAG: sortase [Minisyncoccia bacterium]